MPSLRDGFYFGSPFYQHTVPNGTDKGTTMKIITLVLNWLVVCLFCLISWIVFVFAADVACYFLEAKSLPAFSYFCNDNLWILKVVPFAWGIATLFLLAKKTSPELTHLHTAASVFLGLFLFSICMLATYLPFVGLVTCACGYKLYDPHP